MKKTLYIIGLCVLALVSCKKQESPVLNFDGDEMVFTTRSADTRATGVTEVGNGQNGTAELTSFNVIATKGTGTNQTAFFTDGVFNGTYNGNYTGGKYWPAEETTTDVWNFFASNATMEFNPSGATISVTDCTTDVVAEYVSNANYRATNNLSFDHVLCQLATVTMKAPAEFSVNNLVVTIVPVYAGTYNMATNVWTLGSPSTQEVTIFSGNLAEGGQSTSADNDLWLLPGRYQIFASYTIVKGDFSKEYSKSAYVDLVQGQNNHLRLPGPNHDLPNIPEPGDDEFKEITFTVEVTPWGENYVDLNFGS